MRLRRQVFRAHHPRWAFDPLSGAGAARHGGRFNRRGQPALYTSLRVGTAWLEAQQAFPFKAQPLTLCAYEVDCEDILDLTAAGIRRANDVDGEELSCPWEDLASRGLEPPSWRLASRLLEKGCAGILVPSFAPGAAERDVNAVFWRWSSEPPHRIRVIDDEHRLPRNDLSWRGGETSPASA